MDNDRSSTEGGDPSADTSDGHRTRPSLGSEFFPGPYVDNFKIRKRLGAGGMGDVFLARDIDLGRSVALKFLRNFESSSALEEHRHEAQLTARLIHPNIVTLYQVGLFERRPYLVLEYLDGSSLGQRLSQGAMSWAEVREATIAVASALRYAHDDE
ncbi:MAG: protein kinase, partial [Myxococcota bacterium]